MINTNQIFDIDINVMENADLEIIKNIENKCLNKESLSSDEVLYFLSFISYKVRDMLVKNKNENIDTYNFAGDCTNTQSMLKYYFDDLNIKNIPVQTNRIFHNVIQHSFIIIYLLENNELKPYIVDPTYNQFFDVDKCLASRYAYRDNYLTRTPDPGYFVLKESEEAQEVIKKFLKYGFMEFNRNNSKVYGDSFYYTQIGLLKNEYDILSSLNSLYMKFFLNSNIELSKSRDDLIRNGLLLEPVVMLNNFDKKIV